MTAAALRAPLPRMWRRTRTDPVSPWPRLGTNDRTFLCAARRYVESRSTIKNHAIKITQTKTDEPLSLPLTKEVGEALIDYLKSGRPQTTHREVFLKVRPPFSPFTENHLYHIVTYWRLLSGITFRSSQRRGIHSLRHTLATRLLEKGTPFTTIAEILGHTSLESTRIYAKADIEALRSVALDPTAVNHGN